MQEKSNHNIRNIVYPFCFAYCCLLCPFGCAEADDWGIDGIDEAGPDRADAAYDYFDDGGTDERPDGGEPDSFVPDSFEPVEGDAASDDAGEAEGGIGSACESAADCLDPGAECLSDPTVFPGGYCTIRNCTPGSCPPGSGCQGDTDFICLKYCEDDFDCRNGEGYKCLVSYCINPPF